MDQSKVVLVTGATHNTGLAIARAYAQAGATVILNGLKADDVAREAANLRKLCGATVVEAVADVGCQEQVNAMFQTIRTQCGQLDVLVNNAAHLGCGYDLISTPRDFLEDVFRTNVFGVFACSQAAAHLMLEQGGGAIVHIGSNTAERVIRNRAAYCASKGAVETLTRAMAVELGPSGIRVNSVVAGYIHSDRWAALTQQETETRRANIPLRQEATGRDIADAVMFLSSDAAKRITGECLIVDGGMSAQLTPADNEV